MCLKYILCLFKEFHIPIPLCENLLKLIMFCQNLSETGLIPFMLPYIRESMPPVAYDKRKQTVWPVHEKNQHRQCLRVMSKPRSDRKAAA